MKKIVSFLLLFSLSLFLCGSAMAAEKQAIDLKPAQGNYINLDSVQLNKQENGEYSVSIKGHKDIKSSPVHYIIEVDPEKKTYKTVQNLNPKKLKSESINTPLATSSYNSITVAIWTKDPIGIYTCESDQTLNFNYSNGLITYSTRSKDQWDGQPTGGLTNWYCDYNNFGTFYQGSSTVSTSINAKHHNYDFMDETLPTYAYHYITLYGYGSGSTDYSIDWNYSGEYSYLLGTEVDVF